MIESISENGLINFICEWCGCSFFSEVVGVRCPICTKKTSFDIKPEKKKVFCKNCKYIDMVQRTHNPVCRHPKNKFEEKITTFYNEEIISYRRLPSELNKNNNCEW